MTCRRAALCALVLLAPPRAARGWGEDGHRLILREAIRLFPPDVRRALEGRRHELDRLVLEPDKRSGVPAEGCKHWVNIEKTDAAYLDRLNAALTRAYGAEGWADEDARGVAAAVDDAFFKAAPPPWEPARTGPLWDAFPPTLAAFRAKYPRLDIFIGTVPYQPLLYTRALARALARDDRKRALVYAGYLAHYTADLHVPVHVTANYKGQYSGAPLFDDRERGDPHARFETAYVKEDLAELVREVRARPHVPTVLAAERITPTALSAIRASYALAPVLLEADRKAAARADPHRDWDGYVAAVRPAFHELALRQLVAARDFVADLLCTARAGGLTEPAAVPVQ